MGTRYKCYAETTTLAKIGLIRSMYEGDQHTNFDAAAPMCSTAGSQIEQDLNEALAVLREAMASDLKPWDPPWKKRAKNLLARLNDVC